MVSLKKPVKTALQIFFLGSLIVGSLWYLSTTLVSGPDSARLFLLGEFGRRITTPVPGAEPATEMPSGPSAPTTLSPPSAPPEGATPPAQHSIIGPSTKDLDPSTNRPRVNGPKSNPPAD